MARAVPNCMNPQSFWYRASRRNVVRISEIDGSRWGVYLNEILICNSFGSAEEAAERANKKDFDTETAVERFGGVYVPWDLNRWRRTPPEEPAPASDNGNLGECRNRPWKSGHNRL